jgi:hypothetical protein
LKKKRISEKQRETKTKTSRQEESKETENRKNKRLVQVSNLPCFLILNVSQAETHQAKIFENKRI